MWLFAAVSFLDWRRTTSDCQVRAAREDGSAHANSSPSAAHKKRPGVEPGRRGYAYFEL